METRKILLIIVFLFILSLFFRSGVPVAKAQNLEAIMAQITTLQNQIAQIQAEMTQLQATKASTWCYSFRVDLKYGDKGSEVEVLQTALEKQGFKLGADKSNKYFGDYTASAVVGFQEKYKNEVLDPRGLEYGTGYVDSVTREKLNKLYGCKPESEYLCPDLNKDGIVDIYDTTIISGRIGACKGAANFDDKVDVDGDGCITSNDSNFVNKYYGKSTTEIIQCKGVVITPTLSVTISANPSSGTAPLTGVDLMANVSGTATGFVNYTFYCNRSDSGTNITSGWCQKKDGLSQAYFSATDCCSFYSAGVYAAKIIVEREGQKAEARINIQVNAPVTTSSVPELLYKCPDLNTDGKVDIFDTVTVSSALNACKGDAKYEERIDVDRDNCITTNDANFVSKYYGKKATEIDQCKGVSVLEIESMVASIADAISRIVEEIGKLIR